jgi:hypothetical protein
MPNFLAEIGLTGKDFAYGGDHLLAGRVLGNIAVGSVSQHLIDITTLRLDGDTDDLDIGEKLANGPGGFDPIDGSHMYIHQYNIRLQLFCGINGLLTVGTLCDHFDPGYLLQHQTPGFTDMEMIVDDN